eukprot:7961260-Alexandrium_andersonii.AAC.1
MEGASSASGAVGPPPQGESQISPLMGVAPPGMAAIEDTAKPALPEVTQGKSVPTPEYPPE